MNDIWTIGKVLDWSIGYLDRAGDNNPRLSSQLLLADATNLERIQLYVNFDKPMSFEERLKFKSYIIRRAKGEPIQYITGCAPFRNFEIDVVPGVLIPRSETEILVEEVITFFKDKKDSSLKFVDLCTGSGCISVSLVDIFPNSFVYATDISKIACRCAKNNLKKYNFEKNTEIIECNLGEGITAKHPEILGNIDAVISNPPYIPTGILKDIPKEIREFEPIIALNGGEFGLDFVPPIFEFSKKALKPEGLVAIELHEATLPQASKLAYKFGFLHVDIIKDLANRPRVLIAYN